MTDCDTIRHNSCGKIRLSAYLQNISEVKMVICWYCWSNVNLNDRSKKGDSDRMTEKLNNLEFNKNIRLDREIVDTNVFLESLLKYSERIEWIELLCEIGHVEEFIEILHTSKSELLAIMKHRRILYQQGKGKVSFLELNTAYTNKQFDKLHKLLEKMFLEPISDGQFKLIIDRINRKEYGLEKLYNKHMEDKGLRILSVVLTL